VERAFDNLKQALCSRGDVAEIGAAELEAFAANCTVALAVGGFGSRLRSVTDHEGVNKNALRLPNGDTMLERTIRMYRDAGFRDFVALVFHQADSVVNLLGDGSHLGVRVTYSYDPAIPVGRGGAIRTALESGAIPTDKSLIVHNPDDVIVGYPGSFPRDIVAAHLAAVRLGMVATAVMVEGMHATYTGMRVREGVVEEVVAYPLVPVPAHVGVTLFSPAAYGSFVELFDLHQKMDFEGVLFPLLSARRLLYSVFIPNECWLQVNDEKSLEKLFALCREEEATTDR